MLIALGLSCLGADASAETKIFRPGPCAAQTVYLLAGNSGALIRVEPEDKAGEDKPTIVFRYQPIHGWASQRILKRFDLDLGEGGARIINSGAFCMGAS